MADAGEAGRRAAVAPAGLRPSPGRARRHTFHTRAMRTPGDPCYLKTTAKKPLFPRARGDEGTPLHSCKPEPSRPPAPPLRMPVCPSSSTRAAAGGERRGQGAAELASGRSGSTGGWLRFLHGFGARGCLRLRLLGRGVGGQRLGPLPRLARALQCKTLVPPARGGWGGRRARARRSSSRARGGGNTRGAPATRFARTPPRTHRNLGSTPRWFM
jgi:hypothetical protein